MEAEEDLQHHLILNSREHSLLSQSRAPRAVFYGDRASRSWSEHLLTVKSDRHFLVLIPLDAGLLFQAFTPFFFRHPSPPTSIIYVPDMLLTWKTSLPVLEWLLLSSLPLQYWCFPGFCPHFLLWVNSLIPRLPAITHKPKVSRFISQCKSLPWASLLNPRAPLDCST